ncbi:hypothetical protein DKT77_04690 [Meridianimarinicoccus roseus]|jgi:Ca-activated chloride channel family protein|uniref:Uncharacterized protein n=1 Tax=Meridianimarinicoccus roseus TaxID=2072018 RepID=A0A2V2LNJ4_9RHOB|nr:tetratricopeptide repeat protein [Meridianimarinicoccus roseus]PWR03809.1 hypothetical protein DKT77_04690 [Meridianimarinicoccus roseus]
MRALALATALCAALALAIGGGPAPFGRVLLAAGLPGLAAPLFDDPHWRGVALYRAGQPEQAAQAFRTARAHYNLGNAEARAGRYAAALEAYDRVIPAGDDDARANFDLVASYYAALGIDAGVLALFGRRNEGPQDDAPEGRGNGRASGSGDEVTNSGAMLGYAALISREQERVRRIFDDRFMVADARWLEQLSDVPGAYLAARIAHEHKRRARLGLSPPPPEEEALR